jgi:hypothetical protein
VNDERNAALVFASIWEGLADVLGTAATATLVRRAVKEARASSPGLDGLQVTRDRFEYRYVLPQSWSADSVAAQKDLRLVARRLTPLLTELTGPVVVNRLRGLPGVAETGLFEPEEREE